jgi:hypothetical protein
MKLFTISILASFLIMFSFDTIENQTPQPESLFMKDLIVQPILENSDLPNFRYTRTVKYYYKDWMKTPIVLTNGDLLKSYCSDETLVEIILPGDTVRAVSTKRMSCEILAVVNYTEDQISLLKRKPALEIRITNKTTDNIMSYLLKDVHYFNRALVLWPR